MAGPAQHRGMRAVLAIFLLIGLTACSGDPRSYGITGPGAQPPAAPSAEIAPEEASPVPGVSNSGTSYGPATQPTTGGSGFWGYN